MRQSASPVMYALLGGLIVAVGVLGYLYYQESQKSQEVEFKIEVPNLSGN